MDKEPMLLIDGNMGIYVPQIFARMFATQLFKDELSDLSNPDNEFYWETFEEVLKREFTIQGESYILSMSDGDLLALKI